MIFEATLSLLLSALSSEAQTLTCALVDSAGTPVPYANVYVPAIGSGTVTAADGSFAINVADAFPATRLRFSCIGYAEREVRLDTLQAAGGCPAVVAKTDYALQAAEVTGERIAYTRERTYGSTVRRSIGTATFFGTAEDEAEGLRTDVGFEMGNLMRASKPWALDEITMYLKDFRGDSLVLEFNVYDVEDGRPNKPINTQRILRTVSSADVKDELTIDVSEYGIRGEGKFFVSMEFVNGLGADDKLVTPVRLWRPITYYKYPDGKWTPILIAALSLAATVRIAR